MPPDLLNQNIEILYKEESYKIIGAAMSVHSELGAGFLEAVYHEAMLIELKKRNIPYNSEVELSIYYDGQELSKKYYADIICYNKIILELKAVSELNNSHYAQVFNYLKATGYKLALLLNFGEQSLHYKRIIKES